MRFRLFFFFALLALLAPAQPADEFKFPLKSNSVRFAAIGDMGTGQTRQYEVAQRMVGARQRFPFDFVIMLGDNIYGGSSPRDFEKKFEIPYKPLLDAGVKFYAALGNHDNPNERFYKPFNMNGAAYYTFKKSNVRFFVLDSNYMDPKQFAWLETQLQNTGSGDWKICYFHHSLYSSGRKHGAATDLRLQLEPIFVKYSVNVVFSGHEHVYERAQTQKGIYYFTEGASGQLRRGNLKATDSTGKGFDADRTFMLVEIVGDEMYFETISRTGETVDSGVIQRQLRSSATKSPLPAPNNAVWTPASDRQGLRPDGSARTYASRRASKVKPPKCRWDPAVRRTISICYAEYLASRVLRTVRLRACGVQGFCKNAAPAVILEFNGTDSAT